MLHKYSKLPICPRSSDCVGFICSCIPGVLSAESGLIGIQACLLLSRTWLTDYISRIEARAGRYLIAQVGCERFTDLPEIVCLAWCLGRHSDMQLLLHTLTCVLLAAIFAVCPAPGWLCWCRHPCGGGEQWSQVHAEKDPDCVPAQTDPPSAPAVLQQPCLLCCLYPWWPHQR